MMTEKLEKAIAHVRQLSEDQQDFIAAIIFEELESEARWDTAFANSQDVLEKLAAEVDEAEQQGSIQDLDPDKL